MKKAFYKKIIMYATKPKMSSKAPHNTPKNIRLMEELFDLGQSLLEDLIEGGYTEFDDFLFRETFMDVCIKPENSAVAVGMYDEIENLVLSFGDSFNEELYERERCKV